MSYATIFIPSSGIISAYADPLEFQSAVGIYLITWFMVTVMLMSVPFPKFTFTLVELTPFILEQYTRSPAQRSVYSASLGTSPRLLASCLRIILGENIVSSLLHVLHYF